MRHRRGIYLLAACAATVAAAPPAWPQSAASGAPVKSIITTLTSSGARKECISLSTKQRLRYWYRADAAVNFAIQQVGESGTRYALKRNKTVIGSGTFRPRASQDYCMVWTNLAPRPVTLRFEFAKVEN